MNPRTATGAPTRGNEPGPRYATFVGAVLLGAVLTACAANPFHRQFEAGDYHSAMSTFRADSSLHDDERALYRLGLLFALPESPFYDPARARETLRSLLERYPDTGRRDEVEHLVALLEEIQGLGSRVTDLRTRLDQLKAIDLEESPPDTGRTRSP